MPAPQLGPHQLQRRRCSNVFLPAPQHPRSLRQSVIDHGPNALSHKEVSNESPAIHSAGAGRQSTATPDGGPRRMTTTSECRDLVAQLVTHQHGSGQNRPAEPDNETAPDLRFRRSGAVSYWWAILGLNQ